MNVDWVLLGLALFLQLLTLMGGGMVAWVGINRRLSRLEGRMEMLVTLFQADPGRQRRETP